MQYGWGEGGYGSGPYGHGGDPVKPARFTISLRTWSVILAGLLVAWMIIGWLILR